MLGEFDSDCPYNDVPQNLLCCPEHRKTARTAAEEAIILLRNRRLTLPLKKDERVAIVGVHAYMNFRDWYTGYSDRNPTILDA